MIFSTLISYTKTSGFYTDKRTRFTAVSLLFTLFIFDDYHGNYRRNDNNSC